MSWSTFELREKLVPWNQFKPPPPPQCKYFNWPFQGGTSLVDHVCSLCLVFLMLLRLFIAALWSPTWQGLTSWLLLVTFIVLLWYLIVSFPDLCLLSYLNIYLGVVGSLCWFYLIFLNNGWKWNDNLVSLRPNCFIFIAYWRGRVEPTPWTPSGSTTA